MSKKYMQTSKDRRDEKVGMEKRYKEGSMDSSFAGMISEDYSAPANLPQKTKHEYYPKEKYFDGYYLDDSIKGIDENVGDSIRKIERHQSDSMY